jgi:hypothetical protein
MSEQTQQLKDFIQQLDDKAFKIYFFTLDSKGTPAGSLAYIYENVKVLNDLGYNAIILHEKNDYKLQGDENSMGIADWLGAEYAALPHASIENKNLQVSPTDFIIVPEIFANVMDQIKNFPCKKIVLCQAYDHILELLPIGKRWSDYGFFDCVTTSQVQADYIKTLFPSIQTHIIKNSIPEYFKDTDKPKKPIISIVCRNAGDSVKLVKNFILQYPIYKWVTFVELRGLSRKEFAEKLSESFLAISVDPTAGFGTFPLEAIECNTPIITVIPNLIAEYMATTDSEGQPALKGNNIFVSNTLAIPELIATFTKLFLEDSIPQDLLDAMAESRGQYTSEKQVESIKEVFSNLVENRKIEFTRMIQAKEQLQETK